MGNHDDARRIRSALTRIWYFVIALGTACVPDSASDPWDRSGDPAVITLERTACYGTCPIYKLRISRTGRVEFVGEGFVSTVGTATDSVPPDSVASLLAAAESMNYFELPDRYTAGDSTCPGATNHQPTITTSVSIAGRTKRIVHYRGCGRVPRELTALEQKIDTVASIWRWTTQWLADRETPIEKQPIASAAMAVAASIWVREGHAYLRDSTLVFRRGDAKGRWLQTTDVPDEQLIRELEMRSASSHSSAVLPLPNGVELISMDEIRASFVNPARSDQPRSYHWLPQLPSVNSRKPGARIAMSPMVFSDDSTSALGVIRLYCGFRCSRSSLFWLVRERTAHWRVKGELPISDWFDEKEID
jgi:hypothetical protein